MKVSIVLAVFNGEKYIIDQVDSLLAQTCNDFELIIVDDGSEDRTVSLIQNRLDEVDFRSYQIVRNRKSNGPTRAFEIGVLHAKGEFVAFCDQDDVWMPNKLDVLLSFFSRDVVCVASPSLVIDSAGISKGCPYIEKNEL